MIALDILSDGFFAAITGIGFGATSNPPLWTFKMIALPATTGHTCRYCLMTFLEVDIAMTSLFGASIIGFGSLWLGQEVYCPMTVFCISALLPMILGKFAYNMVFSLIMSLQTMNEPERLGKYTETFFANGLVTCTVTFMLAAGATFSMFLFPHETSSLTRH